MSMPDEVQFINLASPTIREAADKLGKLLTFYYPPEPLEFSPEQGSIPDYGVPMIAWALTEVIAEVLQSYLNAGSESDAIHENLGPKITAEIREWSTEAVVKYSLDEVDQAYNDPIDGFEAYMAHKEVMDEG